MNRVLLIFLDGVGIGEPDPEVNYFFKRRFIFIENIFGETPHLKKQRLQKNGFYHFPVDACLGVEGIPQSGTGQTSIFTGINAPELLGRHFGPYPHSQLLTVIKEKNIFTELLKRGRTAAYLNAFPEMYYKYMKTSYRRTGVISLSARNAGLNPNGYKELKQGIALSPEIDNTRWPQYIKYDLHPISAEMAAQRTLEKSLRHDLTVYEYFLTDHIGHGRVKKGSAYLMKTLDNYLYYIMNNLPDDVTLLICSDHGNLEDTGIKAHTRNPAMTISGGKYGKELSVSIDNLTDIYHSLLKLME